MASFTDQRYAETDPTGRYGRFEDVLGKGAMKTVYKAIDEVLGIEVAWSQIRLNDVLRSADDLQRLYSEIHLLSTLTHQSIIRFYTSWVDVDHHTFNFITEMFTSGSLREYRRSYIRIDIRAIKSWARQILQGLVYLHQHDPPVIHRDLKCDNIFVNGHLGQVKIGDLGLARLLNGCQSARSVIGTPEFMAPELYEEDYNELVDVYSFGMCVLEMITSEFPYSECANPAQIYKKVTSGKLPAAFDRIQDSEAQRFVGKCLVPASDRVSAKELLHDPFLASDESWLVETKSLGNQIPFLNKKQMKNLKLGSWQRTEMSVTGKLNQENDTIFLKVQIADKDGSARNVHFLFDILNDTSIDVAMEMVKELDITNWEPIEIAEMIDDEISSLLNGWKKCHSDHSSSPSSSRIYQDDSADETHSQSSSQSESLPDLRSFSGEDYKTDVKEKQPLTPRSRNLTRFGPEEASLRLASVMAYEDPNSRHKSFLLDPHGCLSSRNKTPVSDNRRLTRNRSLVDLHSQLLHRSMVEEVSKRRLFKTVGDVEAVGFQSPDASAKSSLNSWRNRR